MLIISFLILFLGLILNSVVFYWNEMLKNGFRTGAPYYFIKHGGTYAFVDIILFFIILFFGGLPWYLVIICYLLSMIVAVTISEKKYKQRLGEIIKDEEKEGGNPFTK